MIYNDNEKKLDKEKIKQEFGNRVRQTRKELKISVEGLAESCGVSDQTIKQIESGKRFCKVDVLAAIAFNLGVSTDYLLGIKDHQDADDLLIPLSLLDKAQVQFVRDIIMAMVNAMNVHWPSKTE